MKGLFLDRDGVLNYDNGYTYAWEDFEFIPGAIEGMRKFKQAGYSIFIVTNQSGIARGLYSEKDFFSLTQKVNKFLKKEKIFIRDTYHCPHHIRGVIKNLAVDCYCRKPKPGMILSAAKKHNIKLKNSVLVGDKISDIEAGLNAGIHSLCLLQRNKTESYTFFDRCGEENQFFIDCSLGSFSSNFFSN